MLQVTPRPSPGPGAKGLSGQKPLPRCSLTWEMFTAPTFRSSRIGSSYPRRRKQKVIRSLFDLGKALGSPAV